MLFRKGPHDGRRPLPFHSVSHSGTRKGKAFQRSSFVTKNCDDFGARGETHTVGRQFLFDLVHMFMRLTIAVHGIQSGSGKGGCPPGGSGTRKVFRVAEMLW